MNVGLELAIVKRNLYFIELRFLMNEYILNYLMVFNI